jgi:hypothetical protein
MTQTVMSAIGPRTTLRQAVHKTIVVAQASKTKFTNIVTTTGFERPQALAWQHFAVNTARQWARLNVWTMARLHMWAMARLNVWAMARLHMLTTHSIVVVLVSVVNGGPDNCNSQ